MNPAVIVAGGLSLLAIAQTLACGGLAHRKNRSVPLWSFLGALFGIVPGGFAGILTLMMSAMPYEDQGDTWQIVILLLPFLWPLMAITALDPLKPKPLRAPRARSRPHRV